MCECSLLLFTHVVCCLLLFLLLVTDHCCWLLASIGRTLMSSHPEWSTNHDKSRERGQRCRPRATSTMTMLTMVLNHSHAHILTHAVKCGQLCDALRPRRHRLVTDEVRPHEKTIRITLHQNHGRSTKLRATGHLIYLRYQFMNTNTLTVHL